MAREKSWIPRVPAILKALEADTADSYGRPDVERIFAVGGSQAKSIMAVAGAKTDGAGALSIPRSKLLAYVKYSPEAAEAQAQEERRIELAKKLAESERDLALHKVAIPVQQGDEWVRFRDLVSVVFEPGELRIAYVDGQDLLRQLWLFSRAMGNDYAEFERLTKPKPKPQMVGPATERKAG